MDEVVLLEVRQLSEGLGADRAPEGSLAAVRPQVNLQVGELPEDLVALLTPVLDKRTAFDDLFLKLPPFRE